MAEELNKIENNTETKPQGKGFWRTFVGGMADRGHPVYVAMQESHYPEDALARNKQKDIQRQLNEENLKGRRLQNMALEQDIQQSKELFGYKKQQESAKTNMLKLQQQQAWDTQADSEEKRFTNNFKKKLGYDSLNLTGQTIVDNSPNLKALAEAQVIMQAFARGDEEGDYQLSRAGWSRTLTEDGKNIFTSADGKLQFDASDVGIKSVMDNVQKKLKDDIAAAYLLGGDSTDLKQFTAKYILGQPGIEQDFGSYGQALGQYNRYVNSSNAKGQPRFTKEEKLNHILATSLQAAIVDGKISQNEQAALMPLFDQTVKKFGGEVIWGNDVAQTKIKLANGMEVPLVRFAHDTAGMDVVMTGWKEQVAEIKQKRMLATLALKKAQAEVAKNQRNAGGEGESGTLTDEVRDFHSNMYGAAWDRLDRDGKIAVVNAENELAATAVRAGLGSKKKGRNVLFDADDIIPDKHMDKIKRMVETEEDVLGKVGVNPNDGYWHRMLERAKVQQEMREQEKEAQERDKKEAKKRNIVLSPMNPRGKMNYKRMKRENDFWVNRWQEESKNKGKQ